VDDFFDGVKGSETLSEPLSDVDNPRVCFVFSFVELPPRVVVSDVVRDPLTLELRERD
jgi:hypothetical protein